MESTCTVEASEEQSQAAPGKNSNNTFDLLILSTRSIERLFLFVAVVGLNKVKFCYFVVGLNTHLTLS